MALPAIAAGAARALPALVTVLRSVVPKLIAVGSLAMVWTVATNGVKSLWNALFNKDPASDEMPQSADELEKIFEAIKRDGKISEKEVDSILQLREMKYELENSGSQKSKDEEKLIKILDDFLVWAEKAPRDRKASLPDELNNVGAVDLITYARQKALKSLRAIPMARFVPTTSPLGSAQFKQDFAQLEVQKLAMDIRYTVEQHEPLNYQDGCLLLTGIYVRLSAFIAEHALENQAAAFEDANLSEPLEAMWHSILYG